MSTVRAPLATAALVALAAGGPAGSACAADGDDAPDPLLLEYGTTLALTGDLDGAEAAFSALLGLGPYEAAAWGNLGNVCLIRGEVETARDFYDRAVELDPDDPGFLLNRAVARMVLGDGAGSREDAARALRDCGGLDEALGLLGIEAAPQTLPADEVEHSPYLSEEDVRVLLEAATTAVPEDTTAAESGATAGEEPPIRWRAAGTRATGGSELARVLHWRY